MVETWRSTYGGGVEIDLWWRGDQQWWVYGFACCVCKFIDLGVVCGYGFMGLGGVCGG